MYSIEYNNVFDLPEKANREFENSRCLTTFLMVNFAVKPMSQEHLDYVQKINNKISS